MRLDELQQAFQAQVLRGHTGIEGEITAAAPAAVAARLGVYGAAYGARLLEVLAETFPALRLALGAERFGQSVGEFVRQHPSRFRSARDYGGQLSAWLAAAAGGPRDHGVADLARFEWALAAAFDAADAVALAPGSLAGLAPDAWAGLKFSFSPTLQYLSVTSNAVAWWRFACAARPRPGRWRATCPQHWLIWRQDLAVNYRRLSRAEAQALQAARNGSGFGELCARLSAAQAARLLHGWYSAGLIIGATAGAQA
jgi:hypothetical protein